VLLHAANVGFTRDLRWLLDSWITVSISGKGYGIGVYKLRKIKVPGKSQYHP
jgi:hypothetical protein